MKLGQRTKEPANEKLLWVFCPSLGAGVFGASSSPSVLGFSKSPPSQAGARLSFAG